MAAATFEELKKQIEARVKKALVEDVAEVVKENESDTIERVVYGVYSDPPVVYRRRRGSGGLSDPDNMHVRVLDNAIEVLNNTPPNYAYNGHEEDDYRFERSILGSGVWYESGDGCTIRYPVGLDELVEYGDGGPGGEYTHKHSSKPEGPTFLEPRPFTQETINTLRANKQHVNALRYGLMRSGARVKNG